MKRPPGLWVLLSAGVLWLSMQDVYGIRATALVFGKTTTTTTTTTTEAPASADEQEDSTEPGAEGNSTKPTLTGNPQIDYVWDPNLPKELNGYNLSDYPFYERVPEDIDFKCDGLHDGFYASVKHKCQVYHHCLFGTRYDFLCANYTAFDQTLFNCNFVSNVDCENSKKFWNRNDELYKTQSTTTQAPVVYNFHTPPPGIYQRSPNPGYQIAPQYVPQQPGPQGTPQPQLQPQLPQQPAVLLPVEPKRRARPAARRRPQYDYYDEDEYDDRPLMRRKRPRRPMYDDYYYYDDEIYDRRGAKRRRRPQSRRPMRREKERRRDYYYDDDEYDDEFVLETKPKNKRRKLKEDPDDYEDEENKRRPDKRQEKPQRNSKRPTEEDEDYDETINNRKKSSNKRRSYDTGSKKFPRLGVRRPPSEEAEEDLQHADGTKSRRGSNEKSFTENRPIIKPVSGTLYDRPRVAPRINLPVPKNVADKYSYKSLSGQSSTTSKEDIDVESSQLDPKVSTEEVVSENSSEVPVKFKFDSNSRETPRIIRKRPVLDVVDRKKTSSSRAKIEEPSVTTKATLEKPSHVVRKYKRPFLPSRGGSPYAGRSLQPVGEKYSDKENYQEEELVEDEVDNGEDVQIVKPEPTKPDESESLSQGPTRIVVPIRARPTTTTTETTQRLEAVEKPTESPNSDIDLLNGNYDVTINEALSPILPNLPVRSSPTGFSNANDYIYNNRFRNAQKYIIYDNIGPSTPYYL